MRSQSVSTNSAYVNTDDTVREIVDSMYGNRIMKRLNAISVLPEFDLFKSGGRDEKKTRFSLLIHQYCETSVLSQRTASSEGLSFCMALPPETWLLGARRSEKSRRKGRYRGKIFIESYIEACAIPPSSIWIFISEFERGISVRNMIDQDGGAH